MMPNRYLDASDEDAHWYLDAINEYTGRIWRNVIVMENHTDIVEPSATESIFFTTFAEIFEIIKNSKKISKISKWGRLK